MSPQISNKTYMWGHCHGQSVVVPTETPFGSIHEVFASFAGLVTLSKLNYVCLFRTDGVNKRSDTSRCPCCSEASYEGRLRVFHGYGVRSKSPYKVSGLRWAERNESEKSYFPFWGVNEFLPKANRKKYCADLAVCSPLCHSPSHGHWSSDRPLRTGLALAGTNTFFTRQFEWWFLYVRYHH